MGRVSRAHGVKGEVSIHPLSEVETRFDQGSVMQLEDGRTLTVEFARAHQQRLLVKFEEVADRTAAEALRGEVLLIPTAEAPAAPEGSFWVHEVVGLEVVTEDGRDLGRIQEVQGNPANDLWVTDTGALVPAVREVVTGIDLRARRITVRELPGLFEE